MQTGRKLTSPLRRRLHHCANTYITAQTYYTDTSLCKATAQMLTLLRKTTAQPPQTDYIGFSESADAYAQTRVRTFVLAWVARLTYQATLRFASFSTADKLLTQQSRKRDSRPRAGPSSPASGCRCSASGRCCTRGRYLGGTGTGGPFSMPRQHCSSS